MIDGSGPLEGSAGERYWCDRRGLDWFPQHVGFHPAAPRSYAADTFAPALVSIAKNGGGVSAAVQLTYLAADRSKLSRLTFGDMTGAAVRLSPAGRELVVSEGVETGAAFQALNGPATWATLGTSGLAAFTPPPCVRHLIIAGDNDPPGLRAAHALADRRRTRLDVTLMIPPGVDNDWAAIFSHGGGHVWK